MNGVVETDAYGREGKTGLAAQYEVVVRQGALAPIMKSVFPAIREYGRSVPVLPPMKDGKPVLRTFRPRPQLFEAGI